MVIHVPVLKKYIPSIDNSLKRLEIFLILNAMKSHSQNSFFSRDNSAIKKYFTELNEKDLEISLDKLPNFPITISSLPLKSDSNLIFTFKTPYHPDKLFKMSWEEIKNCHDVKVHFFPCKKQKKIKINEH